MTSGHLGNYTSLTDVTGFCSPEFRLFRNPAVFFPVFAFNALEKFEGLL